ncbi:ferritin-like domain-containing protein [Pontibacter sp. SGAir0037]|uniref:YciE/YciF ferroxidase family protein n=1 Tax=Pontibacter sp. SGAir0037 TaxID=2571030 RepID=UPI0010CD0714|nr:ferritin-like domain-containing protein [Pontibacter sp. SGAir0037]QCR22967.1 ferritin-like domain-containing protein [Pontibacter sp. SGAir0037]
MKLNNLNDLFLHELKDLYNAEHQITKALPKMMEQASSDKLRSAFEMHLEETKSQIERLEKVFDILGEKASGEKCKAMEGIIREASDMMSEDADPAVMDAALIASAQRVEHYEIAGYGTLCTFAKQLGIDGEAIGLLESILSEEKDTDMKLTQIAESSVNTKAEK